MRRSDDGTMLKELLRRNREVILRRWRDLIVRSYPANTARFLQLESDRFHNPVGHALADETARIFDCLVEDSPAQGLEEVAEMTIKIRSVQDFTPSEAVGFIFLLKTSIREQLATEPNRAYLDQLLDLESRIDELALAIFDRYMCCREKVFQIRVDEIKKRSVGCFNVNSQAATPRGRAEDIGTV
ncbi:MAG: RsbRD N-terminal domain-containing protein [Candidatus Zixiibacteriota bacterium]